MVNHLLFKIVFVLNSDKQDLKTFFFYFKFFSMRVQEGANTMVNYLKDVLLID